MAYALPFMTSPRSFSRKANVIGLRQNFESSSPHIIPFLRKNSLFLRQILTYLISKTLGKEISSHHIMIIIVIRILFSLETLPIYTPSKMKSF
jgi:hypothetical protein